MSGMASNYNMSRIFMGLGLSTFSAACSIAGACLSIETRARSPLVALACIVLSYSAMMFGSSYVEEEQNFWFWTSGAWIAHIVFRSLSR